MQGLAHQVLQKNTIVQWGDPQRLGGAGTQRYLGMVQVYSVHGKLLGVLQEVDFCFSWGHAPNGKKGITGGHGKGPPESCCLRWPQSDL